MSKIISCEQLRRLVRHHAGIGEILTEALLSPDHREPMPETIFGEIREFCDPPACELSACGHEASDPAPAPFGEPVVTSGWREEELRRRLYIVKHKNSILSPIAQVFYDYARKYYEKHPEKAPE